MKPLNRRNLTPFQKFEQESRQIQDSPKPKKPAAVRETEKYLSTARQGDLHQQVFQPGSGPTDDDLAPETLIREDGARSPQEGGSNIAADETCRIVGVGEIGAGYGLDEAELAQIQPLDEQAVQPGSEKPAQQKAHRGNIKP